MGRRDLDDLTDREREVLTLLRRDFTNEQIAARLGISLDGAKYHVSQILSKLGVTTREDAAAAYASATNVAEAFQPRRPRWWAALPLAAKVAGVAVMVAVVAGLALLAWGVLRTSDHESGLTAEDVYSRVLASINRPGSTLHSVVSLPETTTSDGTKVVPTLDLWFDFPSNSVRTHYRVVTEGELDEGDGLTLGTYTYHPDDTGEVLRQDFKTWCPGSDSVLIATLLSCGFGRVFGSNPTVSTRFEPRTVFEGRPAVAVIFGYSGGSLPFESAAPGQVTRSPSPIIVPDGEIVVYLDTETFLPLAQVIRMPAADQEERVIARYENQFISRDSLAKDFFDPVSMGYNPSPTP